MSFLSAQPRPMLGILHGTPGCAVSPQKPSQDRHTEPRAEFFKGEASLPLHIHPVKYHLQLLLTAQEAERGRLQGKDKLGAIATGEGSGPSSKNGRCLSSATPPPPAPILESHVQPDPGPTLETHGPHLRQLSQKTLEIPPHLVPSSIQHQHLPVLSLIPLVP